MPSAWCREAPRLVAESASSIGSLSTAAFDEVAERALRVRVVLAEQQIQHVPCGLPPKLVQPHVDPRVHECLAALEGAEDHALCARVRRAATPLDHELELDVASEGPTAPAPRHKAPWNSAHTAERGQALPPKVGGTCRGRSAKGS